MCYMIHRGEYVNYGSNTSLEMYDHVSAISIFNCLADCFLIHWLETPRSSPQLLDLFKHPNQEGGEKKSPVYIYYFCSFDTKDFLKN